MLGEFEFTGRKPSKAQVMKQVKTFMKSGCDLILIAWGENRLDFENVNGYWHGRGWIRNISGCDLANFELNERRSA